MFEGLEGWLLAERKAGYSTDAEAGLSELRLLRRLVENLTDGICSPEALLRGNVELIVSGYVLAGCPEQVRTVTPAKRGTFTVRVVKL